MLSRHQIKLGCAFGFLFIIFSFHRYLASVTFDDSFSWNASDRPSREIDLKELGRFSISPTFLYARCDIVIDHGSQHQFDDRLNLEFPPFYEADLESGRFHDSKTQPGSAPAQKPCVAQVQVPKQYPRPSAAHILFGVATNLARLNSSLDQMAHWATGIGTRIVALVEKDEAIPQEELDSRLMGVRDKAQNLSINLEIIPSKVTYEARWFNLVEVLYDRRDPNTQWFAFIDDDTFFLSPEKLVNMLKKYDVSSPHYVGGLSEDFNQILQWDFMAYGGAGVFLTLPLLAKLQGPAYEECTRMSLRNGDRDLANCIYKFSTTKLEWEHQLHQVDLRGDPSGFYESGRDPPISVHHWKSWFEHDMALMSPVAQICGDDCLLRRWRFQNGNWFLNNGFSIVKYSTEIAEGDITMEKTWYDFVGAHDRSYSHSLYPIRRKDEGKLTYRLEGNIVERGRVRQVYIRRNPDTEKDEVVEIVWRRR